MDVQVKDGLACAGPNIEDGSISLFDIALARNLGRREMTAANDFCIGGFGFL